MKIRSLFDFRMGSRQTSFCCRVCNKIDRWAGEWKERCFTTKRSWVATYFRNASIYWLYWIYQWQMQRWDILILLYIKIRNMHGMYWHGHLRFCSSRGAVYIDDIIVRKHICQKLMSNDIVVLWKKNKVWRKYRWIR